MAETIVSKELAVRAVVASVLPEHSMLVKANSTGKLYEGLYAGVNLEIVDSPSPTDHWIQTVDNPVHAGLTLTDLSGSGSRWVVASAAGILSAPAKPTTLAGYGITDAAPLTHACAQWRVPVAATTTSWASSPIYTDTANVNVGIGGAATAAGSKGICKVNGAIACATEANAFGSTSQYTALVIGYNGLMSSGRVNPASEPFVAFVGHDAGTVKRLYFGGGGWDAPSAGEIRFYTEPSYVETHDAGVLRYIINSDGSNYFYQNTGIGVAPVAAASRGKLNVNGAISCTYENTGAFVAGSSAYASLFIGNSSCIVTKRATAARHPFVTLCGYDIDDVSRNIFIGGGGFDGPDVNIIKFYTATAYNETSDAGVMRMYIAPGGTINVGNSLTVTQKLRIVAGDVDVDTGQGYRINNTAAANSILAGDGNHCILQTRATLGLFSNTNLAAGYVPYCDSTSALTFSKSPISVSGGNVAVSSYAAIGASAPNIAFKKLTGTTGANEGDATYIDHGLTGTKIIGAIVIVNHVAGNGLQFNYTGSAGYEYAWYYTDTQVVIVLHATNSENIKSKSITVLVVYEA